MNALDAIEGGLIVSCQAPRRSPLRDPAIMAHLALAAELGGAVGLRVNGPEDIRAVAAATSVPIVGLHKVPGTRRDIITPDAGLAGSLVDAGADIVAVEATAETLGDDLGLLASVRALGVPVMADIATLDEGLRAWDAGVELVGTTLSGYTTDTTPAPDDPDIALVAALVARGVRVIAEGRYRSPAQVRAAFEAGAFAVVVGGAITDPLTTTERFAAAARVRSR
ncbi:MAG: putative N-acetylmannosamine-6-phosphate 2-epimerase [Microbacteriaceae bacterium]|nr:putative N-acetylmannosamine-6-phosphate 2-epimerase [Microbacteriaceae bacterium]